MTQKAKPSAAAPRPARNATARVLILPDGRVLAHNLTPELAAVLAEMNPHDRAMRNRATRTPPRPDP